METTNSQWRELKVRKEEFLHILRILNHYYEMRGETRSPQFQFRCQLVGSATDQVRIFFSRLGDYEFQVACSLGQEGPFETWIHIDGIAEERSKLKGIGQSDHPVFQLVCLSDLFIDAEESPLPCF
ncbi:hypothetical protein P3G55_11015 [Leptospira sp. 96542]|nr:hypothetical protein [Leptospira sp. 96542]